MRGKLRFGFLKALTATGVIFWLACGGEERAPAPPPAGPPCIAVYGDSRTGHDVHREIVDLILGHEPAVVFHTGDLVENGNDPKEWERFNEITAGLRARAEFYPALGNHENESPLFFENFELPGNEQWYSVSRFGLHFFVLDTNVNFKPGSPQYQWLENELAAHEGEFDVGVFHHPPFSLTRSEPPGTEVGQYLVPLFRKYDVELVFCGHDHNYQRFYDRGIYYVITGGGGAPLYGRNLTDPRCQKFIQTYHYCFLGIYPDRVTVAVVDINGHLIDAFHIDR